MKSNTRLRVSVVGLFIEGDEVLLIHQVTPPEPNCWDLPGGGLKPEEDLLTGLMREVREETGLDSFQVEGLLTIAERFYQQEKELLHVLNIVYRCSLPTKTISFSSNDPEIGSKGIQWLPITVLSVETCSTRTWKALQAAGLIEI